MKAFFYCALALSIHQIDARTITAHNSIDEQSTVVRRFGRHKPTPLIVRVGKSQEVMYRINGGQIEMTKQSINAALEGDKLIVRYDYNIRGRKKGKTYTFNVPPNVKEIKVSFSWKQRPRIIIETNGTKEEIEIELVDTQESAFRE